MWATLQLAKLLAATAKSHVTSGRNDVTEGSKCHTMLQAGQGHTCLNMRCMCMAVKDRSRPSATKVDPKMVTFDRQKLTCRLRVYMVLMGLWMTFCGAMSMLVMLLRHFTQSKNPYAAAFCHNTRSWYSPVKALGDAATLDDRFDNSTGSVRHGESSELFPMLSIKRGTWSRPTTEPSACATTIGQIIMRQIHSSQAKFEALSLPLPRVSPYGLCCTSAVHFIAGEEQAGSDLLLSLPTKPFPV